MKKLFSLLLFTLLAGAAWAADVEVTPVATEPNPFQPLLDLLGGHSGRVLQIVALIGALRIPVKLFSGSIQTFFERALARVVETSDDGDDHIAAAILRNPLYRFLAFLVDMVTSLKLPLDLPVTPSGRISGDGRFVTSLLLALGLALSFTGCGSAPKNTYKASSVTHAGVKAALSGWNDYLGIEYARIGTNEVERLKLIEREVKVSTAYSHYQSAQAAALHAAAEFARLPDDATAADQLKAAVSAAARALSDLGAVLAEFGFKVSAVNHEGTKGTKMLSAERWRAPDFVSSCLRGSTLNPV